MGKGDRTGFVGIGDDSQKTSSFECDVGLGLKMQPTESESLSFSCPRKMMRMPHHPSYENSSRGYAGDEGGGPVFCSLSNQVACVSDIYNVVGASSLSGATVLPRSSHTFTANTSFRSSGQGMPASGKVALTRSQWQELERQMMIYKYMMASIPIPPELLLSITRSPSHIPFAQSNISGLDLRFSSGSDPEPWRCRRTDGKKWRCSRDVAPEQKYCERHAHKSRPRSRKPVEIQSHTTTTNNTNTNIKIDNHHPLILPSNTATTQPFQKPIPHFPTSVSPTTTSHDLPRGIEWFLKGGTGTIPVSTCDQQWQQLLQPSSGVGLKRDHTNQIKDVRGLNQHCEGLEEPTNLNPYADSGSASGQRLKHQLLSDQCGSLLNPKLACLQGNDTTQKTRHFIDAWSTAENECFDENRGKWSVYSSRKPPLSSLTLSMSHGNGTDEEYEHAQMGLGILDSERDGGILKTQWLNPVSWTGSPPGGPLGEALCLSIASTAKATSNVPSPQGYSNSNTTSSCSKSSCEDGSHAHNFIG
ncbi:unnamed protein product [Ilex paraguariensis]|uniref:Growth-regulating factor n=1 Tax=Ilex paraguariensis TaxID=185542 RepID=A0ABC8TDM6_9AQUA